MNALAIIATILVAYLVLATIGWLLSGDIIEGAITGALVMATIAVIAALIIGLVWLWEVALA